LILSVFAFAIIKYLVKDPRKIKEII